MKAYVALTKPRIIELLLVTTLPAMVLAAGGLPKWPLVLATMVGGTLVGIHGHAKPTSDERFDEGRPGLDHVAFGCANRADLETWQRRLEALDVAHGGIVDAHYGSGLSFRDPDNIALELFAPPS